MNSDKNKAQGIFRKVLDLGRLKLTGKFALWNCLLVAFWLVVMFFVSQNLQQRSMDNLLKDSTRMSEQMTKEQIQKYKLSEYENAVERSKLYARVAAMTFIIDDIDTLELYAMIAVAEPNISAITFMDNNGKVLVTAGEESSAGIEPIKTKILDNEGKELGTVLMVHESARAAELVNDLTKVTEKNKQLMKEAKTKGLEEAEALLLDIILISIALSIGLGYLSGKKFAKRLGNIRETVQNFSENSSDATHLCAIDSNDEIGDIARSFNEMTESIRKANQENLGHINKLKDAANIMDKIEILLDIVSKASNGDLTGKVTFKGDEDIDRLAAVIETMIGNLNTLITQVQQSGVQVTSSATEIAATAKQQEATVTEQAASTSQIMATVTEISATTKELTSTMEEVSSVAEATASSAEEGQEALTSMESTMHSMQEATASISSKLAVLNDKASNINNVVTTINKVADQTNLLSLNAAIEAEKAGEYGRGFAVVATEIRRLADQTAVATWDIEQMVKEMQSAVSAGVMGMDKFSEEINRGAGEVSQVGGQLGNIIEQVQTLIPRFETVLHGMQFQAEGSEQINESMTQLNETAHHTAESLHQSSLSISQMKDAAQVLQQGVSKFQVL